VNAERTTKMSKMETSNGPDDTKSEPTMFTRKNTVLPHLLILSRLPLPAPLPEPMTPNAQVETYPLTKIVPLGAFLGQNPACLNADGGAVIQ
jgi:hypothetical protein